MAGAIPITLTDAELLLFARMKRDEIDRFLTELDEHGWTLARAVLREIASRKNYPMNNPRTGQARPADKKHHGEEWR